MFCCTNCAFWDLSSCPRVLIGLVELEVCILGAVGVAHELVRGGLPRSGLRRRSWVREGNGLLGQRLRRVTQASPRPTLRRTSTQQACCEQQQARRAALECPKEAAGRLEPKCKSPPPSLYLVLSRTSKLQS